MSDSDKLAIAAHLHVLLRRKTGRVTDTEWMAANADYAQEIVRFARQRATEDAQRLSGMLDVLTQVPQPNLELLRRAGLRVLNSLFAHAFLRALEAFILVFAAVAVEIFFFADGGSRGRVRAFFAALGCIGATGSHGESEGCEGDGFDHSRSPVGGTGSKVAHLEGGRGKFALIVRKWWAEKQNAQSFRLGVLLNSLVGRE